MPHNVSQEQELSVAGWFLAEERGVQKFISIDNAIHDVVLWCGCLEDILAELQKTEDRRKKKEETRKKKEEERRKKKEEKKKEEKKKKERKRNTQVGIGGTGNWQQGDMSPCL